MVCRHIKACASHTAFFEERYASRALHTYRVASFEPEQFGLRVRIKRYHVDPEIRWDGRAKQCGSVSTARLRDAFDRVFEQCTTHKDEHARDSLMRRISAMSMPS
jgi:hypothetical protein